MLIEYTTSAVIDHYLLCNHSAKQILASLLPHCEIAPGHLNPPLNLLGDPDGSPSGPNE
jgi:hypothetical protein